MPGQHIAYTLDVFFFVDGISALKLCADIRLNSITKKDRCPPTAIESKVILRNRKKHLSFPLLVHKKKNNRIFFIHTYFFKVKI